MAHLEWVDGNSKTAKLMLTQISDIQYLANTTEEPRLVLLIEEPEVYLAALLWVNGRWVLLSPTLVRNILVNQIPLIGLKILNEGDQLQMPDLHMQFVAIRQETLDDASPLIQENKACPICLVDFSTGENVIYCPKCGQAHHLNHWYESGRCGRHPFCGYVIPEVEIGSVGK